MKNKYKRDNTLIKSKNLILILKKAGITRISPEAIIKLEDKLKKQIEKESLELKEKITIKGKRTLEAEDI